METKKARREPGNITNTASIPVETQTRQEITAALRDEIENIHNDLQQSWQWPFLFARAVQVVNYRFSRRLSPRKVPEFIARFCEDRDLDVEEFTDMVWLVWDKVQHVGSSALDNAYEAAISTIGTPLAGKWLTPRIAQDCTMLYEIGRHLSNDGQNIFFLSCRDAARLLGTERTRAAGLLRLLCKRGYFEKAPGAQAPRQAQSYVFKS